MTLPEQNVWPINDKIPSEIASFFDPFGNATHCALSFEMLGEDVLITGAGPIGIMATAISRFLGVRHVVITDVNDYRLNLAKKMGASAAINIKDRNIKDVYRELNITEGFDVGMEMSGNPKAFNDMVENMYHGRKNSTIGYSS